MEKRLSAAVWEANLLWFYSRRRSPSEFQTQADVLRDTGKSTRSSSQDCGKPNTRLWHTLWFTPHLQDWIRALRGCWWNRNRFDAFREIMRRINNLFEGENRSVTTIITVNTVHIFPHPIKKILSCSGKQQSTAACVYWLYKPRWQIRTMTLYDVSVRLSAKTMTSVVHLPAMRVSYHRIINWNQNHWKKKNWAKCFLDDI